MKHAAGQHAYNELLEQIQHFKSDCLTGFDVDPTETAEDLSERCAAYTTNAVRGFIEVAEKLQPCLEATEQYLKQFLVDIYGKYVEDYCNSMEALRASESLRADMEKCEKQLKTRPEINPHMVCWENSTVFGTAPHADVVSKEEFCHDLMKTNFCYDDFLDQYCSDNTEGKRFQRGVLITGIRSCMHVLVHRTTEIPDDTTNYDPDN